MHGDNLIVTGPETDLKWVEAKRGAKYEIKTKFLGPISHNEQEIRVLNRTLRWITEGVEYDADQRHAELIIKDIEMENVAPAPTLGVVYTKEEAKAYEDSALMSNSDASAFRGLAAMLICLLLDRADLQYAAKEVSKTMAAPREADWAKLKRVASYLVGALRLVQIFCWQVFPAELHTFMDSDWAGDKETKKSSSGGAITWCRHTQSRPGRRPSMSLPYRAVKRSSTPW